MGSKDGWYTLIVAAAIVVYAKQLIFILGVAVLVWIVVRETEHFQEKRELRKNTKALLALKAERENALAIQGDPAGIYGDYPAYTIPMTYPQRSWK